MILLAGCTNSTETLQPNSTDIPSPGITSVSTIIPAQSQTIYVEGSGFGDVPPQTISLGDGSVDTIGGSTTPSISISDSGGGSHTWEAGRQTSSNTAADGIGLIIVKWSDSEIVLGGFGQSLSTNDLDSWAIGTSDPLVVNVWTQGGQASYNLRTGQSSPLPTPQPTRATEMTTDDIKNEANSISQAIDYTNPVVRNFATSKIERSSGGVYNIAQICDVWDPIHAQWTYIGYPDHWYYTPASESINVGLKGNCLDYAILNAAIIEAIEGSSRVIVTQDDKGQWHAYAEEYVSDNYADLQSITDYLRNRYGVSTVYYHSYQDPSGNTEYWLNLDWQANNPGGPFFQDNGTYKIFYPNGEYDVITNSGSTIVAQTPSMQYLTESTPDVVPTSTIPLLYAPTTTPALLHKPVCTKLLNGGEICN